MTNLQIGGDFMKIVSVTIEGMHNVVRKTYDISNLTYLHGPNGVGKSTVMQAIQLALLGYIPGTAKTKAELFRHANNHTMAVTLNLSDGVSIRRIWTGSGSTINSIVEITPDGYDIAEIISELELPIFNFSEFVDMTANKLKDWFINFLPSSEMEIDWKIVLKEDLIKSGLHNIDEDLIETCAEEITSYGLSGVDEVRKANEYFKNALSFKKKELERLQSTVQSLVFYDDIDVAMDESEVRSQIDDLEQKRKFHLDAIDRLEKYESAKHKLDEYSDCSHGCAEADPKFIEFSNIVDKLKSDYDNQIDQLHNIATNSDAYKDDISEKKSYISELTASKKVIQDIVDSNGMCPFTSTSCDTISSKLKSYKEQLDEYNKHIKEAEESIIDLTKELNSFAEESRKISDDITKIKQNIYSAQEDQAKIRVRYEKFNTLKESVGLEPVVEEPDADYDSLIKEKRDILIKIEANKRYNELIDSLTSEKFKAEGEIAAYKSWINLTGVNGLQNDDSATKPFTDLSEQMNTYIQTVFGESVKSKFNLEAKANSFSFGIERGGSYIPFNLLSSGEKCLYTLSLMISLVDKSNSPLKIVMVDDLMDHLDNVNMIKLFKQLMTIDNVQMIFAGVKDISGDFVVELA